MPWRKKHSDEPKSAPIDSPIDAPASRGQSPEPSSPAPAEPERPAAEPERPAAEPAEFVADVWAELAPDMLDSAQAEARVEPDDDMSVPIRPAKNPRWETRPETEESFDDAEISEILSEIQSVTAVAQLESRVESLEHDLTRVVSSHEEDAGRLSGELAIMKARIEDALGAVSATVAELRAAGAVEPPPAPEPASAIDEEALKAEIRTGLAEAIETARAEAANRLGQIRLEVESSISTARAEFQSSFTGLLQGLETGLQNAREQALREVARLREKVEPDLKSVRQDLADESTALRRDLVATEETFSGALRAFATRLEGLQAQVAEATARQAAERAAFNASIQGVGQRVDALEERITEGLARLSEGILRVAENVGSATTLQRRIAALESAVSSLQNRA